jgi:lysophospholipase L1-like esterase
MGTMLTSADFSYGKQKTENRKPVLWRRVMVNLGLVALGLIIAAALVEIGLRLYNPFPFRVRLEKIVLLSNIKFNTDNPRIPGLDRRIVHTKNALGFRGDNPPPDFDRRLTILAVGGSTTECFYLSDGQTWPDHLGRLLKKDFPQVWINNAGLDGHSTFGHLQLMQDYLSRLHPRVALFLVGANDLARDDLSQHDHHTEGLDVIKRKSGLTDALARHSEVASLMVNLSRYYQGYRRGLVHQALDLKAFSILAQPNAAYEARFMQEHRVNYLKHYAARLTRLVQEARANGIQPVLLTQPALYGPGLDPVTGVDLANINIYSNHRGQLDWQVLELYNDVTRQVGRELGAPVIDLARLMPKNSAYFYDFYHFTNLGAEKVAELIHPELAAWLKSQFKDFTASP